MTAPVFITGMFRSGTTLVARMLQAHPNIACADDPAGALFKAFRNDVAEEDLQLTAFDQETPLQDYYFDGGQQDIMHAVRAASFDRAIPAQRFEWVRRHILARAPRFAPRIVQFIEDGLQGSTFQAVLHSVFEITRSAYGGPNTRLSAIKEAWAGEFVPHVLAAFPDARAVHIVRDPRAVCASKLARDAVYPLLFMSRQWRKLAAFAYADCQPSAFAPERTHVIRYEDLVRSPEIKAAGLCDFLDVPFDERMTDPLAFEDGAGNAWIQNSSFEGAQQAFNTASIDRWRGTLSTEQHAYVEALCEPEMNLFGYSCECGHALALEKSILDRVPMPGMDSLAPWILPYVPASSDALEAEHALEQWRARAIYGGDARLNTSDQQRAALFSCVYRAIREACEAVPQTGEDS